MGNTKHFVMAAIIPDLHRTLPSSLLLRKRAQDSTQRKLVLIKGLKPGVDRKISDQWVGKERYIAVFIGEFYC
jgi:hypothetical protein